MFLCSMSASRHFGYFTKNTLVGVTDIFVYYYGGLISHRRITGVGNKYLTGALSAPSETRFSWWSKVYQKIYLDPMRDHELRLIGNSLFNTYSAGLDLSTWINIFDLPDTFNTWFLISELHVWMLSLRVMEDDNGKGIIVRNGIVEALWTISQHKIKILGYISAKKKRQYLIEYYEKFKASVLVYDYGINGDDKELANAIWRSFFALHDPPNGENLERLTCYVRQCLSMLEATDIQAVYRNKFKWPHLQI